MMRNGPFASLGAQVRLSPGFSGYSGIFATIY